MMTCTMIEALPGGSSLAHAMDLPESLPPSLLGVGIGAVLGVMTFLIVAYALARRSTRRRLQLAAADDVLVVAPYATGPQSGIPASVPPSLPPSSSFPAAAPFVPSTPYSARAFARMGYAFGERVATPEPTEVLVAAFVPAAAPAAPAAPPAVTVAPVVMIGQPAPVTEESAPHPLAVIPSSSSALSAAAPEAPAGAPIDDLSFDDAPTQFCEPYFDVVPQPKRRGSRPKIRKVAPAPPRFSTETPSC